MEGINSYFRAFKDEENNTNNINRSREGAGNLKLLPPVEDIIKESYKVKISEDRLDELKK